MLAFAHIKLRPGNGKEILDSLASIEGVKEAYEVFGEWDCILKIDAENTDSLNFVVDKAKKNPGVEMTSTLVVAHTVK